MPSPAAVKHDKIVAIACPAGSPLRDLNLSAKDKAVQLVLLGFELSSLGTAYTKSRPPEERDAALLEVGLGLAAFRSGPSFLAELKPSPAPETE